MKAGVIPVKVAVILSVIERRLIMDIKYKYKIIKAIDSESPHPKESRNIVIDYTVKWYYGKFFWQYKMRTYEILIPTCEHPEEGHINLFQDIYIRDFSNDMIGELVRADIENTNIQDGIDIITSHRIGSLRRWVPVQTVTVEINEETGLTKERERSIMKLKEEWFGDDNEDSE